ncbi:hypothetical protein ACFE04_008738 [Oxalis oulophora]
MEGGKPPGRKIMVVAEPTRESAAALQYTLSHAILEQDELILMHIENSGAYPNVWKNTFSFLKRPGLVGAATSSVVSGVVEAPVQEVDFLEEMKRISELAQPKVRVQTERVQMEAKDKANALLVKSKVLGVDVVVVGQKRSISTAILGVRRPAGSLKGVDTADYLIENCKCTCVGVQKKGQSAGYLLNTKTHKNFWLLA